MNKCAKTCRAVTSTSRALCRVSGAIATSSLCLGPGWFTLGFPCVGSPGVASVMSEGCAPVLEFAVDGCNELCSASGNSTSSVSDFNRILDEAICKTKETRENFR